VSETWARPIPIPADLDATIVLVRHGESTWIGQHRFQGSSDPPLSPLGERQADLVARRLAEPHASPALPIPDGNAVGCWHSPLGRATAVAERIAAFRPEPLTLRPDQRLREWGQGAWEGVLHSDLAERDADYLGWRRDPVRHHGAGGEDMLVVAGRVSDALADVVAALAATAAAARAADVGHADVRGTAAPTESSGGTRPPGAVRRDDGRPTGESGGVRPEAGLRRSDAPPAGAPHSWPWALVVAHEGAFRVGFLSLFRLPLDRFWQFPYALCSISIIELHAGRPVLRAHNLTGHLAPLGASISGGGGAGPRA
jgi:broad specificity phosphatase PhoE